MKKLPILLILCLCISCRKPEPSSIMFTPSISAPDKISWDSVAYTTINYSLQGELKDDEWDNPDIYSYSVNLNLRTDNITVRANNVVVVRKFEMIGFTGKVLYYIPFKTESVSGSLSLPWPFRPEEGVSNYTIPVIRYRE